MVFVVALFFFVVLVPGTSTEWLGVKGVGGVDLWLLA